MTDAWITWKDLELSFLKCSAISSAVSNHLSWVIMADLKGSLQPKLDMAFMQFDTLELTFSFGQKQTLICTVLDSCPNAALTHQTL